MRILHLLLFIALLAAPALAAPALVQQKTATSTSVTLDAAPTAGNTLILIATGKASNAPTAVSGGGVTWASAVSQTTNRTVAIWYGHGSTGASSTVTVSYPSGIGNNPLLHISEWSGLANAGPQSTNTGNGTGTAAMTAGSITPTDAVGVAITGMCYLSSVNSLLSGPTNSFNRLTFVSGSPGLESAYKITASASSTSTTVTLDNNDSYGAVIAYFAATTTGPTQFQKQSGFFNLP